LVPDQLKTVAIAILLDRKDVKYVRSSSSRRYLKDEIFDKSTIKNDYQKSIAEVYVISLFLYDILHPMIISIGPKGCGKSLLLGYFCEECSFSLHLSH
jgi:hypothetical protein